VLIHKKRLYQKQKKLTAKDTKDKHKERKVLSNNALTLRSLGLLSELCGKKDF